MTTQLDLFGQHFTGGKQASLFVNTVKSVSDQPQISNVARSVPPSVQSEEAQAITHPPEVSASILGHPSASGTCLECGEPAPPRAQVCPNCYNPFGEGGD